MIMEIIRGDFRVITSTGETNKITGIFFLIIVQLFHDHHPDFKRGQNGTT